MKPNEKKFQNIWSPLEASNYVVANSSHVTLSIFWSQDLHIFIRTSIKRENECQLGPSEPRVLPFLPDGEPEVTHSSPAYVSSHAFREPFRSTSLFPSSIFCTVCRFLKIVKLLSLFQTSLWKNNLWISFMYSQGQRVGAPALPSLNAEEDSSGSEHWGPETFEPIKLKVASHHLEPFPSTLVEPCSPSPSP